MNQQGVISEMIDNQKLLNEQYDVLTGSWPKTAGEMVLVVDQYNQISDLTLYMLGLMNDADIAYEFQKLVLNFTGKLKGMTEEEIDATVSQALADTGLYTQTHRSRKSYTFQEMMNLEYDILLPFEMFKKQDAEPKHIEGTDFPLWEAKTDEEVQQYLSENNRAIISGGTKMKISGIVRLKENATSGSLSTHLCYTKALTDLLIEKSLDSEIVKQQLSQTSFTDRWNLFDGDIIDSTSELSYSEISTALGIVDKDRPSAIYIYPSSFEAKDQIVTMIDDYNADHGDAEQIKYNDYIGLMMSSITDIINAVTYVLIAFVSISLIVSSIMISVITHISVLERTKEIGVLRSIGASKRVISRVFNAETAIIGFTSGILGIVITVILNIPISIIIKSLSGLANIAVLPVWGGIALIAISAALTIIAGLIPAYKASKQDTVVALRSE